MATVQEISEAMQSIETKKQSLKEAFEDLQKHSHSLSSFSLSWPEIDSHFSNIESSLKSRFSILQQKEQSLPKLKQNPENLVPQKPPNPDIKAMCEKMESVKLWNWVNDHCTLEDWNLIELVQALKYAPDPFRLVLEGFEGIYHKGKIRIRLLEGLMMVEGVNISVEVKERAKTLALEWKGKLKMEGDFPLDILCFLHFVACFRLVEEFSKDFYCELISLVAKKPKSMDLCRVLGLEEKVHDIIPKLVSDGRQLAAIKFVYEFKLIDKFPPAELLKSYLNYAQKEANQLRKGGKKDQAYVKEINALKTILKCIEENNLASQFPPERVEKRINRLEKMKLKKKTTVAIQPVKPKKQNQQHHKLPKKQFQTVSKQPVTQATSMPNMQPGLGSSVGSYAFPGSMANVQLGSSGGSYSLIGSVANSQPGLGSSVDPYALSGSMAHVPYAESANALNGLTSSLMRYERGPTATGSHFYGLGSQLPSSSYNEPKPLDGYVLGPQHYPSYHPR